MPESDKPKTVSRGFIIAVVVLIILFVAIALPSFIKARNTSCQQACINNLRIIDAGKEQAAMTYRNTNTVSEEK
jgi:hypothetical protein